jgi:hypothetical protein
MKNNITWFAVVGVRVLANNELIHDANGAYVNIACVADDRDELLVRLCEIFKHNRFEVFDIDDIETEESLNIREGWNPEKMELLNEIKEGYLFAWGTFHSFD